jgi:hypothetical protein
MSREKQGSLLNRPEEGARGDSAPPLNLGSRLKAAMRRAVRESRWSREQIVDRMNAQAVVEGVLPRRGGKFTQAALDGWLAASKANLPDPVSLALFCWAAESRGPVGVLAGSLEAGVVGEEKLRLLAWAENRLALRRLQRRDKQLEPEDY